MARLLSLDDEPEMGDLIDLILGRARYNFWFTSDSYEAWALLHTLPFDLLMQDIMRPDVDGWVFYRLMRADARLDGVPIMMVTAAAQKIARKLELGADLAAYVVKPFDPQELITKVRDVLLRQAKPAPLETKWEKLTSLEECRTALSDAGGQEREAALIAWGWRGRREGWSIEPPIQALKDPEAEVRLAAVGALRRIKDSRAVIPLVASLDDAEVEVRLAAIQALGWLQDARAIEPLLGLLRSPDESNRWAAGFALGRLKAEQAIEPLIAALRDESELVRMAAARSLEHLDAVQAATRLAEKLADGDAMVCLAAADALGKMGDPQTVRILLHALNSPIAPVCEKAAHALARIGGRAVGPIIEKLNDPDERVRRAVARVLWLTRDQRVVQPLIAALQDEDRRVRLTTARTLGQVGDRRAVEPLIAALGDDDPDLVRAAAHALGRLSAVQAVPTLERIAQEDDRVTEDGSPLAEAVRWALKMIRRASDEG
jgi:HEAT repeat protein/DNA-binding NarL/FixJ family response regulator